MKTITDKDFKEVLATPDKLVMVKFGAVWCPPCRAIAPLIEELANTYDGKAIITSMDVDDSPDTAVEYGIRSIPCIIFFKDGKILEKITGLASKTDLMAKIDAHS